MARTFYSIMTLLLCSLFNSCASQSEEDILLKTSNEAIKAIRDNDPKEFRLLIAHDDLKTLGKNDELLAFDIKKYNDLFKEYVKQTNVPIELTNTYNFLGQKRVKIPIYENKKDSSISELHLDLLFGPRNMFPLNKITGYILVENNSDSLDFKPYSYWKGNGIAR